MERRILLIRDQKSFMINAMVKNLTGESYDVVQMEPDIGAMSGREDLPPVMLVYLDKGHEWLWEFLPRMAGEIEKRKGIRLYLAGSNEEIDEAKGMLPEKLISGEFKRPLNVKEMIEKWRTDQGEKDKVPSRRRILVVDDDGTMLRTLKLWLSDRYQVYMANSGANAIALLEQKDVDLVLLDYEMPVASGPQVLEEIRANPAIRDSAVMFLTARNDRESMERVKYLKPVRYLLKTMPPDVLLKNIDEFFSSL